MSWKVNNVYVTYKDRLTRFGYHYLEKIFHHYGVGIVVVKGMERIKSIEQDSLAAKDKLDAIKLYLEKTEEIKKEDLLAIIEETEELLPE